MFFEIQSSEHPALVSDGLTLSYARLAEHIGALGEKLESRTLAFCLCENSPASVISYLSCLNRGVVPLLVDKRIDRGLLSHLLEVYEPNYLFLPEDMAEEFPGFSAIGTVFHYVLLKADHFTLPEINEALALLLTTSGSTGSPKLVRQSYQNIQANAEAIAQYLELDETERAVTTLPMNYTYGLSIINSHLQVGATILMTDSPMNMKPFWNFAKENRATSFGGVPYIYEMLKRVGFFRMSLPDLRYMTQAGGKLSPELHREFALWSAEQGKKFIVMYGQTEATARMGYLPAEKSIEKYGSIGLPIPGGRYALIDADGSEITEPETTGELVYMGPNVTLGYAEKRADLALGDLRCGRLETGDMAKFDSDGYYYIVGRKKRFLKIFGNRVNMDETDGLIKKNFDGLDCASTGIDDHMKIYITDASKISEVRRWISETTHLSETAFEVLFIEKIPRNEAGKVLYKDL